MNDIIEYNDFKRIYRELGLTPQQWVKWQKLGDEWAANKLFNCTEVEVFKCSCGSNFCPSCLKRSRSFKRMLDILEQWDYRKIRNIMLSIDRGRFRTPLESFLFIRRNKKITRLVNRISELCGGEKLQYLWILEFHRDGFPHYHLLLHGKSEMIGKKLLDELWGIGFTWESFIKDDSHWKAIKGYGRKTGYFGFDGKQHQIQLPPDIAERFTTVRKFGTNVPSNYEPRSKRKQKKPQKRRTYSEKLPLCGMATKIKSTASGAFIKVNTPYIVVKEKMKEIADEINYKTFRTDKEFVQIIEMFHVEQNIPRETKEEG